MADLVMVVEVFISQRNADNPLHHQRLDRVLGVSAIAAVLEAGRQATGQTQHPISVAPSSNAPASLVMAPPSKDTTTARPSAGANANRFGLHCVGIGEFLCLNVKPLSQKNFRSIRAPMHLTLVRDAGYAVAIRRDPEATLFHAYNDGFYAIVYFSAVPRGRPGMPKTEIFPEDRAVGEKIAADHAERLEQYKRGQAN